KVAAGPRTSASSPSVSIRATSMPSIEVPLMRPSARIVLPMRAPSCMFRSACRTLAANAAPHKPPVAAMATYKSDFLNALNERGFIHQASDLAGLDALAARGAAIGYIGFDCTAPSFHVGNMIVLMMLSWLQRTGNKPIVLMGGGTTRVGDPSGKD